MAYIYKWIEGEDNLNKYCEKRFHSKPKFRGTFAHVGSATISLVYKEKNGHGWTEFFLLFMEHPKGEVSNIAEIENMTYEQIKTDRNSILML